MGIEKWNPMGDLIALQDRMNVLLRNALNEASLVNDRKGHGWSPQVDFFETEEAFVVVAELPGLTEENIDIQIDENMLILSSHPEKQAGSKERNYYRRECSQGSFKRSFSLPAPVKTDDINAQFKRGVLEIYLPKSTSKGGKTLKVSIKN